MSRHLVQAVAALIAGVLATPAEAQPPRSGAQVFAAHCARCHGIRGDGDTAIARVVSPKPPDLRRSGLDLARVREIVRGGGEGVGRSPIMPRWSGEIADADIEAVTAYAFSLRETVDGNKRASSAP